LLLDLALFFPTFAIDTNLNIPESSNDLADIIDEALFNVDFYKRLQTPNGGIRGGIESEEHPRHGEMSWQESLTVLAYAPGVWSSYLYAGVATRASLVVSLYDDERVGLCLQSAHYAMQWAEHELPNREDHDDPHQVNDARNLAAAELYRATGETRWHDLFMNTTVFTDPLADVYLWESHDQAEAAWVYVLTQNHSVNEVVQSNCYNALIRDADQREHMATSTSYRYTKRPYYPIIGGVFSSPLEAVPLVRAHLLTGEERYLTALILSCQMGAGANPLNLCYTTGIGSNYPENVLHLDSRMRCLPAPTGLTALGPLDHAFFGNDLIVGIDPFIYPTMAQWPVAEFFFDVFWLPMITEFTIHIPMASNSYVWGYLAARS
jgi:endoglucanase